jgi:hypothetical protein
MGFSSFANFGFEEFVQKESAPHDLWIFTHVPKTAGSSLVSEISYLRRPYRNIHVDYEDTTKPYDLKLEKAVDQFIQDNRTMQFRACSGHITMRHVAKIREACPHARVVSILRNPVERVISDFRYARTPAHPPYKDFIRQFPTIESYVDSPSSQNKMFRFLTPDPDISMAELFEYLDKSVSFIGLTEMYPMSFNIVTRLFGLNRLPTAHLRKTEPTKYNQVARTPDLLKRIKETNARDRAMFRFVKERLVSCREQWLATRGVCSPRTRAAMDVQSG